MSSSLLSQLEEYAREDPQDPFNHYALALEYLKTDVVKAQLVMEQLIVMHSQYVPTYYQLGKLYAEKGDAEAALSTFERGIVAARNAGDHKALREIEGARLAVLYDN